MLFCNLDPELLVDHTNLAIPFRAIRIFSNNRARISTHLISRMHMVYSKQFKAAQQSRGKTGEHLSIGAKFITLRVWTSRTLLKQDKKPTTI